MIKGKRFILKGFISAFSIKIRNTNMQMLQLIKEDPTVNVPKEIFRTPIFTVRSSSLVVLREVNVIEI